MNYTEFLTDNTYAIYLLHGVHKNAETKVRNYTRKHIPDTDFIAFLKTLLEAGGTPVSMDDIVNAKIEGRALPPKSFAITFDDGFENNLTVAAPILESLNIPATYYITTDFIDQNRMSWIDRIELVVEESPVEKLSLPWGEESFKNIEEKRRFLDNVRLHVKTTPSLNPDEIATQIQNQLGFDEIWSSTHPLDQKLNWSQVKELSKIQGSTIGGHTHTHPIMSYLNDNDLSYEIDHSLILLKEKGQLRHINHYSYPEGLEHCYNQKVIDALKQRNIVCSPSAIHGINDKKVDLFNLLRVTVT